MTPFRDSIKFNVVTGVRVCARTGVYTYVFWGLKRKLSLGSRSNKCAQIRYPKDSGANPKEEELQNVDFSR